jgi:aminopeptidase N
MRRVRAWVPCVDTPTSLCPYDITITVAAHEVAVASGRLDRQAWADGGARRTFHYSLAWPAPPGDLAFAVGERGDLGPNRKTCRTGDLLAAPRHTGFRV